MPVVGRFRGLSEAAALQMCCAEPSGLALECIVSRACESRHDSVHFVEVRVPEVGLGPRSGTGSLGPRSGSGSQKLD